MDSYWRPRRCGVLLVFAEFCLIWEGFVCSHARDLYVSYLSAMKSSIFATVVAVTSMYIIQIDFQYKHLKVVIVTFHKIMIMHHQLGHNQDKRNIFIVFHDL